MEINVKPEPSSVDDDDPVVMELPIFNSKRLEGQLYAFEYPLQPKTSNQRKVIRKCAFKPANEEIELQQAINVESPNFDQDRAQVMAEEIDGPPDSRKNDREIFFENNIVDKVFLKSSKPVADPSRYAAMTFNGKELHLTAVKNILQFWPHFPHLDRNYAKRKRAENPDNATEDDGEVAGPSNAEQITVKFKHDDRWKKGKTATSFKDLQAKSAEEPWRDCVWHEKDSINSNVAKLKLIAENTEETGQCMNLTNEEYVRILIPENKEQGTMEPTLPSHVMSLHALRALPIREQCKLLLKDAQIIQFQQLLMLLAGGDGVTADTLLKTLPKVAVLVRGNWVIKSEVLYPADSFSAISGVPAELMCRARDYVLYLFTKNQYVERKKVSSVMKIPSEEVKEIFTGVSKLSHNRGWELAVPVDSDFILKHNDIVQRQMLFWEQRYQQLSECLVKDSKDKKQRRKSKSFSEDCGKNSKNVSSDNDSGTEKNKSPIVARKNKNRIND